MLWLAGWSMPSVMLGNVAARFTSNGVSVTCDFSDAARPADHVEIASRALDRVGTGVTVVGWSLGAMVALELARARPESVETLVLMAATDRFVAGSDRIGWPARVLTRMRARLVTDARAVVDDLDRRMFSLVERERGDETAWLDARGRVALQPLAALDAGLGYLAEFEVEGRDVAARTFLLQGRDDVICPLAGAERLARSLPRAELTVWDDVGHVPFWTRPRAFSSWLRESVGE